MQKFYIETRFVVKTYYLMKMKNNKNKLLFAKELQSVFIKKGSF